MNTKEDVNTRQVRVKHSDFWSPDHLIVIEFPDFEILRHRATFSNFRDRSETMGGDPRFTTSFRLTCEHLRYHSSYEISDQGKTHVCCVFTRAFESFTPSHVPPWS